MSWRIVKISKISKLDLKLNHLVVRNNENIIKIVLSEISILIIENTAVSITIALLSELTKRKIKVIFCDEQRNPSSELIPYYGSHDTSLKIKNQIAWTKLAKKAIWTAVVREKINKQKEFLKSIGKNEASLLEKYINEIKFNDISNREGHAAKVYFNALFGVNFTRDDENNINAALNYGYGLILSAFNREVVSAGFITQLGICHDNIYNKFNLSCDLMEPFRPLVDRFVFNMDHTKFESKEKLELINILNSEVYINLKKHYVNNAIKIYCKSIFDALLTNDLTKIRFYKNEL